MGSDFRILGELQVIQDGDRCDLGSLRQRGLLARLILRAGQPLTADRLVDELWPDDVPDTARHTLHVYVSRLRSALGSGRDRLQSDTSGYRLRVDADELDATRFERLAAAGRTALSDDDADRAAEVLRQGLELWRGPALAEFADEPFASTEATRLDQLRLAALEDRIWADLRLGRHTELTEELRQLTLEQPFREVLWEQYMLALYRSGRQADALHVYSEARMRLADDLGIEPGPALRRMEERILAQDPGLSADTHAAPPRPTSRLPLQRTTFIGRERDLAIAAELLAASRLLTLTGAPGSGKTRMALRLASAHGERFRDGVHFVALASVDDPQALETAIVAALEIPGATGRTAAEQVSTFLRGQQALLILDNFEQLADAAPRVGRLLDAAPDLSIMVTSRAPLGIAGEQEFPVLPLRVPPLDRALVPSELLGYDSVELFVARARASDPTFEVTADNAEAIAGITARLDGLPLAIELGAGRLRLLTPRVLLERLERRLPLLASGSSDAIARHQTLRSAISWSYGLLPANEQLLFRRLGAFVGGFTVEAATLVSDRPIESVWEGVESLLAKSLLTRSVDVGEARFGMLQTLREFALEELEGEEETGAVFERHAGYYLDFGESAGAEIASASHDAAMTRLGREIENIRAVLRRCAQGLDVEIGLRLASSIWRYWQRSGQLGEGRDWLERLLERGGGSPAVRARALSALADLAYWQADHETAFGRYAAALAIQREIDDEAMVDTLNSMSMTATWRGDATTGAALAAEALDICEADGATARRGQAFMAQGFALWQEGRYAAARPLWHEALGIARELGDDTLAVTQLAGLAGIEYHEGDARAALDIALEALSEACDLQNVALCAWMLDFVAAFAAADVPEAAVTLAGAADASRQAAGGGMRLEDLRIESARVTATGALSEAELDAAWDAGRALPLSEAIAAAYALRGSVARAEQESVR